MGSGIYFPICALFFSLLTIITFYAKKTVKSGETTIYKYLMLTNFVGLILEILCTLAAYIHEKYFILSDIILKSYLLYNLLWTFLLMIYVFYISTSEETLKKIKRQVSFCGLAFFFISVFFIYYLDCILVVKDNFRVRYTTGPSVNFTYTVCSILIFMIIIAMCISDKKKENVKSKYIPIYVFLIALIIGIIIQKSMPGMLIITYVETLTVAIMFQTIENPDLKLLKEIHRAKEISDNANEEKTMFLYNITQEIRTTTVNIDEETDVILGSKSLEKDKDSARNIKGETSKFKTMMNDIFDVSTIDSSNIKIYNNSYDFKLILKTLVSNYNNICKNKSIEFRTNIEHNIPNKMYGDGINLKKIINLLLSYSTKNTKNGFIELDINTIIKNDLCRLVISIEDSSMGIKSEEIEKIKSGNNNLSEVYKTIVLLGGTMMVTSEYGIGNKFKIVLDQKIDTSNEKEHEKYEEIYDNTKILVVDDSEASIKIIEKLLKDSNIVMEAVNTGRDAIDKIKTKNRYDLILVDEKLNQVSGEYLLNRLQRFRNFNIPVILMSKDNKYEYSEEYKEAGFSDIIIKPLKKEILLKKINKYCKKDEEDNL